MKSFLFIGLLLAHLIIFAQPQRLAILPSSMRIGSEAGSELPSVCLDFFRDQPGKGGNSDQYTKIKNIDGSSTTLSTNGLSINDYRRVDVGGIDQLNGPLMISTSNDLEGLSTKYRQFIANRIEHYKTMGSFTESHLADLQDEIWAYDVLQHLGYIDGAQSAVQGYNTGKVRFAAEFLGSEAQASTDDILDVGGMIYNLKASGPAVRQKLSIIKTPATGRYFVFNSVAPPLYRGTNIDEMINRISSRVNTGDLVAIESFGFENEVRAKAFMKNIQRKLHINHNKRVSLTNYPDAYLWEPHNYVVGEFQSSGITTRTVGNSTEYVGGIKVASNDDFYFSAGIEAASNQRSVVVSFFSRLTTDIRNRTTAYALANVTRRIRNQVGTTLGRTDYLNVFIEEQGGARTLVKLRKGEIIIVKDYAYGRK